MNIFVAGLSHAVTDLHLELLFGHFGTVNRAQAIAVDRGTGESKQFGFVEMPNDTEAQVAIAKLDGALPRGKRIIVKQARGK